ncbi:CobW/HypB/UreG, nucleotide-binding domain-containing protein [Tirmania nivea]|nr:CobW/HypB/UreG, nucleotide-binding domain-containing protein [Tirmania nivea]
MAASPPIPITILTGFLGAGKTTLLLNLLPQLPPPPETRLCLLKNEFGSVAVDSRLFASASTTPSAQATPAVTTPGSPRAATPATPRVSPVAGVQELLNGCICCNLVGQLGDALEHLRNTYNPTRIVIETSGSAFPATLAMEVNRLSTLSASGAVGSAPKYFLDGTILVVDCENFKGYEDTSYTAKLQAAYTDLVVLNKWEDVGERRVEDVVDSIMGVCEDVPVVRSRRGWVDREVLLGVDKGQRGLLDPKEHIGGEGCGAVCTQTGEGEGHKHVHKYGEKHMDEVDVLSVRLPKAQGNGYLDYAALDKLLTTAPKDEVYRIKALFKLSKAPPKPPVAGAQGVVVADENQDGGWFILNWAFRRWAVTRVEHEDNEGDVCDLTVVLAQGEGRRWKKKLEAGAFVVREGDGSEGLMVEIVE